MTDDSPTPPPNVQFNYIKSASYREAACDGVLGGLTPQGKLWVSFYTERAPIPRITEFKAVVSPMNPNLATIDETQPPAFIESRQGIVRNVEFGVYMDLEAAKRLHGWLTAHIVQLEGMSTEK